MSIFYIKYKNVILLGAIFTEFIQKLDEELQTSGRHILVYVDNFSGHPNDFELRNIELKFLPLNSTSKSQVFFRHYNDKLCLASGSGNHRKCEDTL